jgi:DNA (cytosine-5)-methyltransferase 1
MAFPQGWTIPSDGDFKRDDLESLRYHALGNAVTPPVAAWIAGRVKEYLLEKSIARESPEPMHQQLAAAGG